MTITKQKQMRNAGTRRRMGRFQKSVIEGNQSTFNPTDPKSPDTIQSFFCDPFLKKRIDEMRMKTRVNIAKQGIKDLYGRYSPVDYRPQFGFEEGWQNTTEQSCRKEQKYGKPQSSLFYGLQWVILLGYSLTLWFLSIYRVFKVGQILKWAMGCMFLLIVSSGLVKEWSSCNEEGERSYDSLTIKKIIKRQYFSILFLLYLGLLLAEINLKWEETLALLPLDLFFMIGIYSIIKRVYVKLRIKLMSSPWRNELEIGQLVGGCLSLVHLFVPPEVIQSIILILASQSDEENNWRQHIDRFDQSWVSRYLYSLYFACTTMFTVGYGDITPKNKWEIVSILVVQVVGMLNIGYVINEVGRFVSKINQDQDRLYRNISNAEKFSQNYKLPEDLTSKMRAYLVSNQIASSRFNVEEEDDFMKRLNEEVRQCTMSAMLEVVSHNRFQLIKNSVFFLCHWTKKFQRHIALKLQRNVYSPGDVLLQSYGNERIYILQRGKIDIEPILCSKGKSLAYLRQKALKTLEISSTRGVQFNVYGYSALISGLKVSLKAIAKDYSICYSISREHFLEALALNNQDGEYFHEIRSRIEESYCKEAWQAPKINQPRQHFIPMLYLIIKRQKQSRKGKNARSNYLRPYKTKFKVIQAEIIVTQKQFQRNDMFVQKRKESRLSLDSTLKEKMNNDILKELDEKLAKKGSGDRIQKYVVIEEDRERDQEVSQKMCLMTHFESAKNYSRFRPRFNYETRVDKYNQKFSRSNCNSSQSFSALNLGGFDTIGEEAKLRLMNSIIIS